MLTNEQMREFLKNNLGLADIDQGRLVFIRTDDFFHFASEIEKMVRDETCTWISNSMHSSQAYDTECGFTFMKQAKESHIKYCGGCGKKIEVV
jgi:hypothetical protein